MARLINLTPVRGDIFARLTGNGVGARARAETHALHRELAQRHRVSPYAGPDLIERLAAHVMGMLPPVPPAIAPAIVECARQLITYEAQLFDPPPLPDTSSAIAGARARAQLRQQLSFFAQQDQLVGAWISGLAHCLTSIVRAVRPIPTEPSTMTIDVLLVSMLNDPIDVVGDIVRTLLAFAPDPTAKTQSIVPGARIGQIDCDNLCRVSRLSFDAATQHPERLRFPSAESGSAADTAADYLAGMPFQALLAVTIPLPVPQRIRFETAHIQARIGFGKTQLGQNQFLADVDDPARPAAVWLDSQTDAIATLSHLARFDPAHDDRLIILDPTDAEYPLRLNVFDVDRDRIDRLPIGEREEVLAGIIEVYEFIFSALLSSELTGKQTLVTNMLAQLMVEIPNATIHSLVQLLQDPTPFLPYVARLPATARTFITDDLFADRQYGETRKQIKRRLYQILSVPVFDRMFSHPRNGIDMKAALDSGKIILINTAKGRLKSWSPIFGRLMIALIRQATLMRAADPEHLRRPAFVYIDECHEYLDENVDGLILQARKYKVGLTLINQTVQQLQDAGLKSTVVGMPALRFTGELSAADAAVFAPEMKTSVDFLMSVRKTQASAEFACHVRNVTPHAVKVTVPFFTAEQSPRMSDAAYQRLLDRIRAEVATPLATVTEPQRATQIHTNIPEPDDFADHY